MGSFGFGPMQPGRFQQPATSVNLPLPSPAQVPPACPPTPVPVQCRRTPILVDGFYSDLPPAEVAFVRREARVPFSSSARFDADSGTILQLIVPPARTLVVTDLSFFADVPDGSPGRFEEGDLRGFVALGLLF